MTDNTNLIEEIQRKQAELLTDFDQLKAEGIEDYDIIESIQREQATLADNFSHWLENRRTEGGEEQ